VIAADSSATCVKWHWLWSLALNYGMCKNIFNWFFWIYLVTLYRYEEYLSINWPEVILYITLRRRQCFRLHTVLKTELVRLWMESVLAYMEYPLFQHLTGYWGKSQKVACITIEFKNRTNHEHKFSRYVG